MGHSDIGASRPVEIETSEQSKASPKPDPTLARAPLRSDALPADQSWSAGARRRSGMASVKEAADAAILRGRPYSALRSRRVGSVSGGARNSHGGFADRRIDRRAS